MEPILFEQVYFEDVRPGQRIPALSVTVDPVRMFFFSAATYNGHRIHYDRSWARDVEGYPDTLVQGPLQAALLAKAVTDWIGGAGRLVTFSVRNRMSAHPGERLLFGGVVTATRVEGEQGLVDVEIKAERGDDVLLPGTATVCLPRRSDPDRRRA
ncbi:MaoC-like protein [Saccharomonospora marina XMU15]|uniref:MaoC-like protein n=1 Tax=Saccharomonospora marina XMU15 TaxID=882083 RepID=H5X9D4_9PSEU|nr:MaoC/PaaZ C-terminal domain-containing protein [Saccharomonospora marina]EHR50299.1 MaoC-like protein [Saccharomonospora marina XMU15]